MSAKTSKTTKASNRGRWYDLSIVQREKNGRKFTTLMQGETMYISFVECEDPEITYIISHMGERVPIDLIDHLMFHVLKSK